MRVVRYSRQARADLRGIHRYSAETWSDTQADRYIARFHAAFWMLAREPKRGRKAHDLHPDYWKYNIGSHVVFFRVIDNGIEVVRVLHQRQDIPRHL